MNSSLKHLWQTTKKPQVSGAQQRVGSTTQPVSAVHLLDAALTFSLLMIRIRNRM
jgi:hypothetical protein